jgi:MFS transporter, DHA2 family, methylenomycin A resistance protein
MYDVIFLLPVLWQASGLLRPEGAGLALLASTLVILLISSRSGHLANRFWRTRDDRVRQGVVAGRAAVQVTVAQRRPPTR